MLKSNGYNTFAIPWGAAHIPIFATMLEQNNFMPVAQQRIVAFSNVDGPGSAAWVKQIRIQMRVMRIAHVLFKMSPLWLALYAGICYLHDERVFYYKPSTKRLLP